MSLRFKRYYPLILLLAAVLLVLAIALGDVRVIAYTSPGTGTSTEARAGDDIANPVDLFDETVVHSVQIIISAENYESMLTTYQQTGLKEYFPADVIIDGVPVNNVGIRLKGNSSLRMAVGGGGGNRPDGDLPGWGGNRPEGGLPGGGEFNPPAAGEWPERPGGGLPEWAAPQQTPAAPGEEDPSQPGAFLPWGGGEPPEMGVGGNQPPAGFFEGIDPAAGNGWLPPGNVAIPQSVDGGVKIPYLIKFDEYVPGQTYQGHAFLSLRTYGMASDNSMLQEPVTNAMFRLAGLPATRTSYAGLQIQDEPETLYVLSEVLNDEAYLERHFSNPNGVLFKAELGSSLAYVDEDPSSYTSSFSQETRENDADYAALIDFVRFIDQSDEATFERDLPNYLDIESFATYLALNDLLVNTDSLIGMNNNYYLYYDDIQERFTLLYWDGNESLGKLAGGNNTTFDLYFASGSGMGPGARGIGGRNTLLERFMAIPAFKALYESKLQLVYDQVYRSGAITQQVQQYADLVRAANAERSLVPADSYETSVASVLAFISGREVYLETTDLLGGQ